jgi:tetratricopeptide (TPR) repeat protein
MQKHFRWTVHLLGVSLGVLFGLAGCAAPHGPACGDADIATSLAVCTEMIESGRYVGRKLADPYGIRAQTYVRVRDYDRALADFDRAIELGVNAEPIKAWIPALVPTDRYEFLIARGNVHYLKGDYRSAVSDYSNALERYEMRYPLSPGGWVAFNIWGLVYTRGKAYYMQGDRARATADFTAAMHLCLAGTRLRTHDFCRELPMLGPVEAATRPPDHRLGWVMMMTMPKWVRPE